MKVLFVGDAVVSSGFARCTHAACDALHAAGHEVAVLGINYHGDPHSYPYPIYPCHQPLDHGRDGFGTTRLPYMIHRLNPDIVVLLNDPWNIPAYIAHLKDTLSEDFPLPALVGWLAVDGNNQQGHACNDLDHIVTWTQHAQDELVRGGCHVPMSIVTLGVDHSLFQPHDKAAARYRVLGQFAEQVGDAFIVGAIGRNQYRKRLDLTIQYFAEWYHRDHPNAYLYLHVGPTGDTGADLRSLISYYKVGGRVMEATVPIGSGAVESIMPDIYSMLDVYVTTSQGEGFGLPCLEAMACGVPCIVPAWSALSEWPRGAVVIVPCTSTALTAPTNGRLHTVGGIADKREFINALSAMCKSEIHRATYSQRGKRRAADFSWENTGRRFVSVLERLTVEPRVAGDLGKPRNPPPVAEEVANG